MPLADIQLTPYAKESMPRDFQIFSKIVPKKNASWTGESFLLSAPPCHPSHFLSVGVRRWLGTYKWKEFPGDGDLGQSWEPSHRPHVFSDSRN